MRIGIDGACLANRRGFGRFSRLLLDGLGALEDDHQWIVFLDQPSLGHVRVPSRFQTHPVAVRKAPSEAASAKGRRGLGDLLAFSRAAASAHLDVLFFPSSYSFVPVWNVPRVVVTIFDTLPYTYPELVFPTRSGRWAWTLKEQAAVRCAARVVTASEHARRDIAARFRLDPSRIDLVPGGPDPFFYPRPDDAASRQHLIQCGVDPGRPFLLYVGGISPHKNLPRLIQAFDQLDCRDAQLVLVGDLNDPFHSDVTQVRQTIDRLALADRIILTGFVSDETLAHLYSRSHAVVIPSLMEGFGLPSVEAMACGTALLHSTAGSLPEVAAGAGVSFDPLDVPAITRALASVLASPDRRDDLAARALRRAGQFSWRDSAVRLRTCLEEVAQPRARTA